jgi:hypothetical protein
VTEAAQWSHPQPDWLPLDVAKFHFFPDFAEPGHAWKRDVLRFVRKNLAPSMTATVGGDNRIYIEAHGVRLEIDGEHGWLSIEAALDAGSCEWPEIFSKGFPPMDPEQFLEYIQAETPLPAYEAGAKILIPAARSIWVRLTSLFDEAVETGKAQIFAQRETLWAPFERIYPHQYRYFTFTPTRHGNDGSLMPPVARGPIGELAFNPYVAGVVVPRDAEAERRSNAKAAIDDMITDRPDMRKVDIIKQASTDYGVSPYMAKVLWTEVQKSKAPENRRKSGAPKKAYRTPNN